MQAIYIIAKWAIPEKNPNRVEDMESPGVSEE